MPAHLPDHTARMILVHHRLAALAPVERPRVRLDDTDGGSLPTHSQLLLRAAPIGFVAAMLFNLALTFLF